MRLSHSLSVMALFLCICLAAAQPPSPPSTPPSPPPSPHPVTFSPPPYNQYGYYPSLAVSIVGIVVFGLSGLVHAGQAYYYTMWWMLLMVAGCATEVIGYVGRLFSHYDPTAINPFLAQITTLIIAPAFFSAALYVVLMRMAQIVGRQYSPIPPVAYIIIFSTADVISLVIQAIGGGMASQGEIQKNQSLSTLGTHVMVAGICWQMFTMVLFVLCAIIFVLRVRAARIELPSRLKWFAFGMGIVTVCIFIRCVYRTIELLQGWSGWIITHEVFFICLELVPMGVCVWAFNLFHPGIYLAEIEKPVAVQAEATQSTGVQKVPASPEDSAVEIVTM